MLNWVSGYVWWMRLVDLNEKRRKGESENVNKRKDGRGRAKEDIQYIGIQWKMVETEN
jgi:hypothetical protein